MKNEYGTQLDRNGYAPSILGASTYCSICYHTGKPLQRHEVIHGMNRQKAKAYGLWINVCPECHAGIHHDGKTDRRLKEWAQRHAMLVYGWTVADFRKRFGKSYV